MTLQPLALTMGEPAGIGAEIAAKAWRAVHAAGPAFFLIGDPGLVRDIPAVTIEHPGQALAIFRDALPILPLHLSAAVRPGQPDAANAPAVIAAIEQAVRFCLDGQAAGMVTNPIQKSVLTAAGFAHPGHTEFLGELAGSGQPPVMLLACPGLRVVPVTVHLALKAALHSLTTAMIVEHGRIVAAALRQDFGIAAPRIVVAGLNPHAGEAGTMGREDIEIVAPAIAALRADGIDARGPLPADTLFTPRARAGYDCALCMYHDQALIPIKTLDMDGGVNVTLGLRIVRTSPDHGTALDIAGTGQADAGSLIAALRLAAEIAATPHKGSNAMTPLLLSINVDHVATLRNARGGTFPDPVAAAHLCLAAGAEGITIHLREDRRHIRDHDVERMRAEVPCPLNLEMAATPEMVAIAIRIMPHAVCLVPEKRQELTTEGGLDVLRAGADFAFAVQNLTKAGIRTSIFVEADPAQIEAAARIGANCIELHTGRYADARPDGRPPELARLARGAEAAAAAGLLCHAGHGLDFDCIGGIAALPQVSEVSIGHFLIGQSVFEGLPASVRRMRQLIDQSRIKRG